MSRCGARPPVLLCLLSLAASAAGEPSPATLRRAIANVVSRPELATAFCGVEVRSLPSGRVLYALDAERAFRPASTLKLVTTAAALDAFGPDARFLTTAESAGRLDELGRILGDLFLVGRGDPSLSSRFGKGVPATAFETLAGELAAAGVRRIEGRVVGHEGGFAGERRGHDWTWEDLVWGYGAEVSALSWNDNQLELQLHPGARPGDPAMLEVAPEFAYPPSIASSVVTSEAGTREEIRLEKEPCAPIALSGRLPLGAVWSGRVAVENPALYAAAAFVAALQAKGIRVSGGVATTREPLPTGARVLARHLGAPLAEIVRVVNKESANLQAEMLLRLLGQRAEGEGSVEKGAQAALEALARLGVPTRGFSLSDGSGLAQTDLVTPHGMAALLVAMDNHRFAAAFRDSLPIAGQDGTLAGRLLGPASAGRIAAKTGTLSQVSALTGYATTPVGDRLAFSIFVNNFAGAAPEAQAAVDAIARALVAR